MIYADNAATTMLDPEALEAMMPFLRESYANPSQPYSFSRTARKALQSARETIAGIIGATPHEIFFTSGGTESDNWAIKGTDYTNRKEIITSRIEHHAVLNACAAMERAGKRVTALIPEADGTINCESLQSALSEDTALVTIQLVNNELGTIEPIRELSSLARKAGAILHTDAVQALGHIPVDVQALGVDLLSASAHKFHGPKGIGFLYKREGVSLSPLLDGGAQESGARAGTENVAAVVGMAKALEIANRALPDTMKKLSEFETILLEKLHGLDFRYNSGRSHAPGNMSLSFPGFDGEMILHRMDLCGISIATGSACTSGRTGISHVLEAIALDPEYARGTIRVSLGRCNTKEEVLRIGDRLREIICGAASSQRQ